MVERVAEAIFEAVGYSIPLELCRDAARAAIEAMRDNPEGADAIRILTHSGTWERTEELWEAGIDAALSPHDPTEKK
jgi:hypothetical protein